MAEEKHPKKNDTPKRNLDQARRFDAVRTLWQSVYVGRRRVATAAAAVLALGLGYHVVFGAHGLTAYQQKRQETQALREELQTLQRENDALKGHVDRLGSDPNAIEHQAREELHYTRPGEVIYALPGPGAEAATGDGSHPSQ